MFYAGTNYVELDDYSEAKKYLMESLVIFRQMDKSGIAWQGSAYLFLAHNARYHNKWKEAETYYEKATVLFEKILFNKNEKNEFSRKSMDMAFIGTCKAYKWLQQCFYINKNQKKAIEVYRKVKALKKAKNSLSLIADIYPGIISNYMDLKKYEEALFILDEGLGLYGKMQKSSEDQDQFATLWWLKANIFHLSGQCERAVLAGEKAYAEFAKNHDDNSRFLTKISSCIKDWKSLETKK
jgi:tetratricopeptide (TPR) repeat protein